MGAAASAASEAAATSRAFVVADFAGATGRGLADLSLALALCQCHSVEAQRGDLVFFPPVEKLVEISRLVLDGNHVAEVPDKVVACERLAHVSLEDNVLGPEVPGALLALSALTHLSLARNRLAGFPSPMPVRCCPLLTVLNLEHNFLRSLGPLTGLPSLVTLNVAHNDVSELPPELGATLTNLQTLTLHHNHLRDVSSLASLTTLRYLHLNDNYLEEVDALRSLHDLRVLALQHNLIGELAHNMFEQMSSLQTLALNDNVLLNLPPSLGKLSSLNRLFAHENLLCAIPPEIGQCAELSTLRIEYNDIRVLPDELTHCSYLLVVIAHNNKILAYPEFVQRMPQLLRLSLEFNPIPMPTRATVAAAPGLRGAGGSGSVAEGAAPVAAAEAPLPVSLGTGRQSISRASTPRRERSSTNTLQTLLRSSLTLAAVSSASGASSPTLSSSPPSSAPLVPPGGEQLDINTSALGLLGLDDGAGPATMRTNDFKPTQEFHTAFEHFVEALDLSPSKRLNFMRAPAPAKLTLMRQHRDAVLRLFLSGRASDELSEVPEAVAAHAVAPQDCVKLLEGMPALAQLERLLAGLREFQDAWFGMCLEFGLLEELLRLLHRMYVGSNVDPDSLLAALCIFETLFDAVWKTVLVTHSAVPVLLLHLDNPVPAVVDKVLDVIMAIVQIPEAGVCVLLKALETRQRMTGGTARLMPLYTLLVKGRKVGAFRVLLALLEQCRGPAEREAIRDEFVALHLVGGGVELIKQLAEFPEMQAELGVFLESMREDKERSRLSQPLSGGTLAAAKLTGSDPLEPVERRTTPTATPSVRRKDRGSKMVKREVLFDVTSMPPLAKLRKRDLALKMADPVAKICRKLVLEFGVDPSQDYRLMFLGGEDEKTQVWLDDDKTLSAFEGVRIENGIGVTPLFFSLKPVPMSLTFPSGETRTVSLVLASRVGDVLDELRGLFSDLPDGPLVLSVNKGRELLAPGESLSSQGVEPYTVIFVGIHDAGPSAEKLVAEEVDEAAPVARKKASAPAGLAEVDLADARLGLWDEPSGPRFIVFDEMTGEVTSASLNKMVERMTSTDTIDSQLTQMFFYTFKSFATAEEVWEKLVQRYRTPNIVPEADARQIRVRVCVFLKKWLEARQTGDFSDALLAQITSFVEAHLPMDSLADMQVVLLRALTGSGAAEKVVTSERRAPPKPRIPKVKTVSKMSILDIDPTELARQITLQTWDIFCRIRPNEFFNQAWMRKDKEQTAPNLLALINLFNTLSGAFATLILTEPRLRRRVALCERLIEVVVELRKLNNFLMVMSVISCFAQASINRLRFTLEKISELHRSQLRELQALMNPEKSFQQYRQAYNQCLSAQPIPYIGVYLTDLTFIEEATLSRVGPRINVQKHLAVQGVLEKLMVLRGKFTLNMEPVESIQMWLSTLPVLSDKALYDQSLAVEPRGAEKVL